MSQHFVISRLGRGRWGVESVDGLCNTHGGRVLVVVRLTTVFFLRTLRPLSQRRQPALSLASPELLRSLFCRSKTRTLTGDSRTTLLWRHQDSHYNQLALRLPMFLVRNSVQAFCFSIMRIVPLYFKQCCPCVYSVPMSHQHSVLEDEEGCERGKSEGLT